MKRSELKKIIKEELLREVNVSRLANGILDKNDIREFERKTKKIWNTLSDNGFLQKEIKEYLNTLINGLYK